MQPIRSVLIARLRSFDGASQIYGVQKPDHSNRAPTAPDTPDKPSGVRQAHGIAQGLGGELRTDHRIQLLTSSETRTGSRSYWSRPLLMRSTFRMSLTSLSRYRWARSIRPNAWSCASVTGPCRPSCRMSTYPEIALSGVRNS